MTHEEEILGFLDGGALVLFKLFDKWYAYVDYFQLGDYLFFLTCIDLNEKVYPCFVPIRINNLYISNTKHDILIKDGYNQALTARYN